MTLREFISQLNEATEPQKDKVLKYPTIERNEEIDCIQLSNFDGAVLLTMGLKYD